MPARDESQDQHSYPSLTHKDSNLNRQNQNLQCYRYTMGQLQLLFKSDAKITSLFRFVKIF